MAGIGGAELLRSVGLLVDGPALLGKPVAARRPGVFVVELGAPLEEPPIDVDAVRRWLERVPALAIDGARPTTRELVDRLASFWLPTEQIVFIGRSRRAVGARLAAMAATPLGDARPSPAGNWLKTLSAGSQLRVWWADTDANEEYEDELLERFAAQVDAGGGGSTPDQSAVLPFANLSRATGRPKAHGITDAVREVAADPVAPAATRPKRKPARRTIARQPGPRVARAVKQTPPAAAPTYLSAAGRTCSSRSCPSRT
jgi:hypothetical protein